MTVSILSIFNILTQTSNCLVSFIFGHKLLVVITSLIAIFTPLLTFYYCMLLFLGCNFLVGLWADLKRGGKFSKEKFFSFLCRIILYILSISLIFIFEKYLLGYWGYVSMYLTNMTSALLCLFELNSILVNAGEITGLKIFGQLMKKLKEKIKLT